MCERCERIVTRMTVNRELLDYIQCLEYEVSGLKILHNHALAAELPEDTIKRIYDRYIQKFQEFSLAKNELWEEYGRDYRSARSWRVDYQSGVLYIEQ